MLETLAKYLSVVGTSMLKFLLGPLVGLNAGLSVVETALLSILGMMMTVVIVQLLGNRLRMRLMSAFYKERRIFTKQNRRIVRIWRSYGLWGVAILTPVLFSPPGGAFIAVAFGEDFNRIFRLMLLSAIFWGFSLSLSFHFFGDMVSSFLGLGK